MNGSGAKVSTGRAPAITARLTDEIVAAVEAGAPRTIAPRSTAIPPRLDGLAAKGAKGCRLAGLAAAKR